MSYNLKFLPIALKEWNKLGNTIRVQFKKKIAERLENPLVPADRLHGFENHFKIKLISSGHRFIYEVIGEEGAVCVIAAVKRNKSSVCREERKGGGIPVTL